MATGAQEFGHDHHIQSRPARKAGSKMIVDLDSWEAGYGDGLLGRPSQHMPALDWFSYSSGYLQARARRAGTREDFRRRAARPSTQRAPRGGSSRLIII